MPWIPHLMILDDDPRVLESLVPGFVEALGRSFAESDTVINLLRPNFQPTSTAEETRREPVRIKLSAHGFESRRIQSYRSKSPHEVHLHLVRERGGNFDLARRLLNQQLFTVVVSDQRFSDDAGGQRAGRLFIDEASRVHPELVGLLYSAYPKPDDFPAERFIRKTATAVDGLVDQVVQGLERVHEVPAIHGFAHAIGTSGIVYQSLEFGRVLAELYDLARLIGSDREQPRIGRPRRPLACLLIDGESGTGKRGLTELFHAASDRRDEPLVVASCSELTNETLLRSTLFGHKRGAFTDAKEDRAGLVRTAGRGIVLLDDLHRLPPPCSAILHSFLEDGEFGRLGEEERRERAEGIAVLTVETGPWRERRDADELPLAFLARVERLMVEVPPLRARPDDIEAQAKALIRDLGSELGVDLELSKDAVEGLRELPFDESNSRELRNVIERVIYRHYREADEIHWSQIEPLIESRKSKSISARAAAPIQPESGSPTPALNDWQRRLRKLACKLIVRERDLDPDQAEEQVNALFDHVFPSLWEQLQESRLIPSSAEDRVPLPLWENLWRCFSVSWLGGPSPAEKDLGIPANTLRQWINDRESK